MNQKHLHHKPRYIAFVAASVDGRISLAKSALPDWTSKEDWQFLQRSLSSAGAVVVGRSTYKAAAARLRKRNTYVLSRRVTTLRRRGSVTFVNPAVVQFAALLQNYRTVAVLGGATVYRAMLEKNLLDELYITIEPLLFGRGSVMFAGCTRTTRVRLLSVKRLNRTGTLLLHYQMNRQKP